MLKFKKLSPLVFLLLTILVFSPYAAAEMAKVNINTASLEELATLERIGMKYAQRIIEFRENTGPFSEPEDLLKVKGIGLKTFEANKEKITVK